MYDESLVGNISNPLLETLKLQMENVLEQIA